MLPHLFAVILALTPSIVSAALYPKDSLVKTIDTRGFRNALKENRTSVVAFVASWCGYCKAMVPEYGKAARGLSPLVPLYAVDCDENRSLCAEQGVKGFPTVKLFPRGKEQAPILFEHPDRTAKAFFYFATRRVPHKNKKLHSVDELELWVNDKIDQIRVLLFSKAKDIPLLWKVLANKYRDDFAFASHLDRNGKSFMTLGFDGTHKETKIVIYPVGSAKPFLFEGALKYNSISKFFDSVLAGTANLTSQNFGVPEGSDEPTPEEEYFEWRQESPPLNTLKSDQTGEEDTDGGVEDLIHRAIRIQRELEELEAKEAPRDEAGDTDNATTEAIHLSTTINVPTPPASATCIQDGATAPSCASPVSGLPIHEGATAPESRHVKDEL